MLHYSVLVINKSFLITGVIVINISWLTFVVAIVINTVDITVTIVVTGVIVVVVSNSGCSL